MVRSKALIKADLLDTYNMFIRPTKNFLFASEVQWFQQIRTFSRIFNLKIGFLKSTRIKKWAVAYVCRNKNRFTHRMITPFVSADSYGLEEVFQKKFWVVKSLKIFFTRQNIALVVCWKTIFYKRFLRNYYQNFWNNFKTWKIATSACLLR